MSFAHLHVLSQSSRLDGFSNIKKLVKRAKEMDMPAIALTDHGTMFGTIIGALMMTELSNSIVVLNISQYWEQVMTGGVVLIAVAIDAVRSLARSKT